MGDPEREVPRSEVEYVVYRARDLLERGQEHDAWSLLEQMCRRIGSSEVGPNIGTVPTGGQNG